MKKFIIILLCLICFQAQAATYAVVNGSGTVVNVAEWDGNSSYAAPDGDRLVLDPNDPPIVGIGWTYANGTFSPPTPPTPTPAQQAVSALSSGLTVTSTSTPALNGAYGLDQTNQNNVSATVTYILLNGTFPGGVSTMPWVDQNGGAHVWPSVTEFKAFATAYANYVSAIALYAASNGASGSIPSNQVTIP